MIARGGFKKVDAQRRALSDAGLRAEVVCPPGGESQRLRRGLWLAVATPDIPTPFSQEMERDELSRVDPDGTAGARRST